MPLDWKFEHKSLNENFGVFADKLFELGLAVWLRLSFAQFDEIFVDCDLLNAPLKSLFIRDSSQLLHIEGEQSDEMWTDDRHKVTIHASLSHSSGEHALDSLSRLRLFIQSRAHQLPPALTHESIAFGWQLLNS